VSAIASSRSSNGGQSWGTGRARRATSELSPCRTSISSQSPGRRAQRDVYINAGQASGPRWAARRATSRMFPHRDSMERKLADRVRMEFGRVPHQEFFRRCRARNAAWVRLLQRRGAGRAFSGGKRTPCELEIRTPGGPDFQERGFGVIGHTKWGVLGGRAGGAAGAHLRHHPSGRHGRIDEGRPLRTSARGEENIRQRFVHSRNARLRISGSEAGNPAPEYPGAARWAAARRPESISTGDSHRRGAGAAIRVSPRRGPRSWALAPDMLVAEGAGRHLRQKAKVRRE